MKNVVGPGDLVNLVTHERRQRDLPADGVRETDGLKDDGGDTPDDGPESAIDRLAKADCGDMVVERWFVSLRPSSVPTGFHFREVRGICRGEDGHDEVGEGAEVCNRPSSLPGAMIGP